jgi:hypothetical protein
MVQRHKGVDSCRALHKGIDVSRPSYEPFDVSRIMNIHDKLLILIGVGILLIPTVGQVGILTKVGITALTACVVGYALFCTEVGAEVDREPETLSQPGTRPPYNGGSRYSVESRDSGPYNGR